MTPHATQIAFPAGGTGQVEYSADNEGGAGDIQEDDGQVSADP